MDVNEPLSVVRGPPNWALETPTSYRLLGLVAVSVVASIAVLVTNRAPPGFWRGARDRRSKKALHNLTIIVTDVLAGITLVNGVLAFFGA